jgi:hypothetical protein
MSASPFRQSESEESHNQVASVTTADIIRKLQAFHVKAKQLNEQMEALAAECCRVLLVDPERESIERDWCEEIVFHGADPAMVYSRIKSSRRGELET